MVNQYMLSPRKDTFGMLNLNLGSGTNRKQDYISVDYFTEADVNHDLTKTLPYEDESVDNIYACHVIEHFSRADWENIRKDWARVLKVGGKLEIRCPDIIKVCKKLIQNPEDKFNMMTLYGAQHSEGEYHLNGFTEKSLRQSFPDLLSEVLPPSTDYELHMMFTKESK